MHDDDIDSFFFFFFLPAEHFIRIYLRENVTSGSSLVSFWPRNTHTSPFAFFLFSLLNQSSSLISSRFSRFNQKNVLLRSFCLLLPCVGFCHSIGILACYTLGSARLRKSFSRIYFYIYSQSPLSIYIRRR